MIYLSSCSSYLIHSYMLIFHGLSADTLVYHYTPNLLPSKDQLFASTNIVVSSVLTSWSCWWQPVLVATCPVTTCHEYYYPPPSHTHTHTPQWDRMSLYIFTGLTYMPYVLLPMLLVPVCPFRPLSGPVVLVSDSLLFPQICCLVGLHHHCTHKENIHQHSQHICL